MVLYRTSIWSLQNIMNNNSGDLIKTKRTGIKSGLKWLLIVQIVIFGLGALVSYFTGFSYSTVLTIAGGVLMIFLLPWNSELQSYGQTSKIMMHHAHHQTLKQMSVGQRRWYDNFLGMQYGLIPLICGIILATR